MRVVKYHDLFIQYEKQKSRKDKKKICTKIYVKFMKDAAEGKFKSKSDAQKIAKYVLKYIK